MNAAKDEMVHQFAWVFDLNKCIGCQTCSLACKVLWTLEEGTEPKGKLGVKGKSGVRGKVRGQA